MIYIVSGLPRSGTSMMMQMLEAGGLPVLIDVDRQESEAHPGGRCEYMPAMKLWTQDYDWMKDADGKAVKVLAHLLIFLPKDYEYKIIFMRRKPEEIKASYKRVWNVQYNADVFGHISWLNRQANMQVLYVDYAQMVNEPNCAAIANFLDLKLDVKKMNAIPSQKLHRIIK